MSALRKALSIYGRIATVYGAWWRSLLLLAACIFLPLGLIDSISNTVEVQSLDFENSVELAATIAAFVVITTTSLLGQVFYSGAVSVSLTRQQGERLPRLRELAGGIAYGPLILVDLVYVASVIAGLTLLVVPGILAFVYLSLAGPIIELEHRGVLASLRRSFEIVRGNFLAVALVLIPIEIGGEALAEAAGRRVHEALGDSFIALWLAESAANILVNPIFAIAAVLMTVDLIAAADGDGPRLNRELARAEAIPA